MSSYFSLPSFARAKKNQEDLEKTNPQEPLLKDEDEKFLQKVASAHEAPQESEDAQPEQKTDEEEVKEAPKDETEKADAGEEQAATSEVQPDSPGKEEDVDEKPDTKALDLAEEKDDDGKRETDAPGSTDKEEDVDEKADAEATPAAKSVDESEGNEAQGEKPNTEETKAAESVDESKENEAPVENADDPPEQTPEASSEATSKKPKKDKGISLPSQEEAEAATRGSAESGAAGDQAQAGEKRTWASYLPTMGSGSKKDDATTDKPAEAQEEVDKRTWTEYASSYVPSTSSLPAMPNLPSLPTWSRGKDAMPSPVYNEDGSINEEKTKEKQEQEVSVLLDNLNASSINNRVFSLSGPMQDYYARFTQCLKDTMNGAPTAYEDMDKLMKEAGPQLQKQFESMPPFVQMLVKTLPAKMGTTLGPEILAAASEKPGADASARLQAASKQSGSASPALEAMSAEGSGEAAKKNKKKTPGMKKLVSQKGAVASTLNSIVNFIKLRFPFLASATNVLMSLAVFILMMVFWYCHKRGREARLAKEGDEKEGIEDGSADADDEPEEFDATDEEDGAEAEQDEATGEKSEKVGAAAQEQQTDDEVTKEIEESTQQQDADAVAKQDMVNQSDPDEVPLPEGGNQSAAEKEAEKAVGV